MRYLERCSRDEGLPALIAPVFVSRASTHRFRADDRLVIIIVVAIHKYPRDSLFIVLLRACYLDLRDFLLLVGFDRIAKSTDRMRQFGFCRCLWRYMRRILIISTRVCDNAVVAGGQQLRERVISGLEGWFVIFQCVRNRRDLIRGCEWNWGSIGLLDLRF